MRKYRWTHPEIDPVADSVGERCVDGFIELEEDLKSELRSYLLSLNTHTHTFISLNLRFLNNKQLKEMVGTRDHCSKTQSQVNIPRRNH